jgi:hypothetical protein
VFKLENSLAAAEEELKTHQLKAAQGSPVYNNRSSKSVSPSDGNSYTECLTCKENERFPSVDKFVEGNLALASATRALKLSRYEVERLTNSLTAARNGICLTVGLFANSPLRFCFALLVVCVQR